MIWRISRWLISILSRSFFIFIQKLRSILLLLHIKFYFKIFPSVWEVFTQNLSFVSCSAWVTAQLNSLAFRAHAHKGIKNSWEFSKRLGSIYSKSVCCYCSCSAWVIPTICTLREQELIRMILSLGVHVPWVLESLSVLIFGLVFIQVF